jgi:hypothetical protein
MNKSETDCQKQKNQFFSSLTKIIIVCILILVTISLQYQTKENKNRLIETFKNSGDLVCNTKDVSLKNGYIFNEKEKTVSDGINIFRIENCRVKDL